MLLGSNEAALRASRTLREQGMAVPAIRFPTIPRGTARLRVSLSAARSTEEVDRLVSALEGIAPASGERGPGQA